MYCTKGQWPRNSRSNLQEIQYKSTGTYSEVQNLHKKYQYHFLKLGKIASYQLPGHSPRKYLAIPLPSHVTSPPLPGCKSPQFRYQPSLTCFYHFLIFVDFSLKTPTTISPTDPGYHSHNQSPTCPGWLVSLFLAQATVPRLVTSVALRTVCHVVISGGLVGYQWVPSPGTIPLPLRYCSPTPRYNSPISPGTSHGVTGHIWPVSPWVPYITV